MVCILYTFLGNGPKFLIESSSRDNCGIEKHERWSKFDYWMPCRSINHEVYPKFHLFIIKSVKQNSVIKFRHFLHPWARKHLILTLKLSLYFYSPEKMGMHIWMDRTVDKSKMLNWTLSRISRCFISALSSFYEMHSFSQHFCAFVEEEKRVILYWPSFLCVSFGFCCWLQLFTGNRLCDFIVPTGATSDAIVRPNI